MSLNLATKAFDLKTIRDKLQLTVQSINNKYYLSNCNCKQIHNVQKEEGDLDFSKTDSLKDLYR